MSFLNATLVLGTLAAVVPIVLHLIARKEPRKVVFGSIGFLTKRVEANRSRLKVRRWWLLALRIAAVAAMALTLARPAIDQSLSVTWISIGLVAAAGLALLVMASVAIAKGQAGRIAMALGGAAAATLLVAIVWGSYTFASGAKPGLDQSGPVAIAIVLDNSPTSSWRDQDGAKIEKMRDLAAWMITQLPRTSRIAVMDRSSRAAAFSLDAAGAISKIEQAEPQQNSQPIETRIDAAARLLRTSDLENRQILVITDLAKSTWKESIADAGLVETLSDSPAIGLTVFDLGEALGNNVSLSIAKVTDPTPAAGVPVKVSTVVSADNRSGTEAERADAQQASGEQADREATQSISVTAELQIYQNAPSLPIVRDGEPVYPKLLSVDRTSTRLRPGQSQELLLTVPELSIGVHHGVVRLTGDDAMPIDDARFFSLEVLPPASVLLVGEDETEANIVGLTISTTPGPTDQGSAEYVVERIAYADLRVARLADYKVVVMLDPPAALLETSGSRDSQIMAYLSGGGKILAALGPEAGNEPIETAWLPKLKRRWRVPDRGTFLQVTDTASPITGPLVGDTPWNDYPVFQYWQVETSAADTVLARYADQGHAAVLVHTVVPDAPPNDAPTDADVPTSPTFPAGQVLVITTPIPSLTGSAGTWNGLYSGDPWPAFIMVHQAVETLAGRGGGRLTGLVGSPQWIEFDPDQNDQETPSTADSELAAGTGLAADAGQTDLAESRLRLQLFPPDRGSPVPLDIAAGTSRTLINQVSRAGTYWIRRNRVGLGFSANLPPEVTDVDRADKSILDATFGADGYNLAVRREEIELAGRSGTQRVSLHSPAMLMALIVFLLEQILGNRFYRSGGTR